MLRVYTTYVRSVAEYAVPSFHSMMTKTQKTSLERQQYNALKIIYGFTYSYTELLSKSGLDTLEERRKNLTDKFALKMKNNPKYSHYFPERGEDRRRARNGNKYVEHEAGTARLYNSPLFYMRRRLNVLEREGRTH